VREIVLDTETTGLDPANGDRVVEIGCVELFNTVPTSRTFHVYLDPERDIPEEAFRVHGLSYEFLKGKPKFVEIAQNFLDFINDSRLVIHNAEFDIKFLNSELKRCKLEAIEKNRVVDTLALARRKHPGSSNNLDALCSRYKIDNSKRSKHGALLDAEILADVYIELIGGRQTTLTLQTASHPIQEDVIRPERALTKRNAPMTALLTATETQRHLNHLSGLGNKAFWRKHLSSS
jgi:DNA polymerase-3 subunit epsilon